jgi:hypothetical protein
MLGIPMFYDNFSPKDYTMMKTYIITYVYACALTLCTALHCSDSELLEAAIDPDPLRGQAVIAELLFNKRHGEDRPFDLTLDCRAKRQRTNRRDDLDAMRLQIASLNDRSSIQTVQIGQLLRQYTALAQSAQPVMDCNAPDASHLHALTQLQETVASLHARMLSNQQDQMVAITQMRQCLNTFSMTLSKQSQDITEIHSTICLQSDGIMRLRQHMDTLQAPSDQPIHTTDGDALGDTSLQELEEMNRLLMQLQNQISHLNTRLIVIETEVDTAAPIALSSSSQETNSLLMQLTNQISHLNTRLTAIETEFDTAAPIALPCSSTDCQQTKSALATLEQRLDALSTQIKNAEMEKQCARSQSLASASSSQEHTTDSDTDEDDRSLDVHAATQSMEELAIQWQKTLYIHVKSNYPYDKAVAIIQQHLQQIPHHLQHTNLAMRLRMTLANRHITQANALHAMAKAAEKRSCQEQAQRIITEITTMFTRHGKDQCLDACNYGSYQLPSAHQTYIRLIKMFNNFLKK